MIFGKDLIPRVLDGSKTVTRRPVKWEDTGFEVRNRACKYKVGTTYAVQPAIESGAGKGRGGKGIARILILDVRRGLLGGVDAGEAQLEGFPSVVHFRRYWCHLYDVARFDSTRLVDRIEFELLPQEDA